MTAYHYIALDTAGKKHKGIIEAENAKQARQLLRDRHLLPLETEATHQKTRSKKEGGFFKASVSHKELSLLTRQLATLLSAGLPIEEVLSAVAEQTEKPKVKSLILSVRSKVLEGHSLAHAMRDFPNAFSELYCATVAAGERSGHIDLVLERLADYTEQQHSMRQKIRNALIYPGIMVGVSISIVGFLLEYVVPKMVSVYSDIHQNLPGITQFLINLSDIIKQEGIYLLLGLVLFIYLFLRASKHNLIFREKLHQFYLNTPVIGKSIKMVNTARFSRTFAILSGAGVPVIEAMKISSELVTNIPIRKALQIASDHVKEGANIHLALKQTKFFPPMSLHLIASGETGGQLEPMLERAANNQDNDIRQMIDTSLTLFEPAIILVMGGIVLFIVLAILLPVFQLDQLTG